MATSPRVVPQPTSPRRVSQPTQRQRYTSPPPTKKLSLTPPPAPRRKPTSTPLMTALRKRSLPQVRAILESDPAASADQFPDAQWQHPLCYAAQSQCDASILGLLLDHGADINASDMRGRTALVLLCQTPAPVYDVGLHLPADPKMMAIPAVWSAKKSQHAAAKDESHFAVATYLLARGADASIPDIAGVLPSEHALACGRARLACLYQNYGDVQKCMAFSGVLNCGDSCVSAELAHKIYEFLVPHRVLARLGPILDGMAPPKGLGAVEQQTQGANTGMHAGEADQGPPKGQQTQGANTGMHAGEADQGPPKGRGALGQQTQGANTGSATP